MANQTESINDTLDRMFQDISLGIKRDLRAKKLHADKSARTYSAEFGAAIIERSW
jgi:hypothetical protein